MLLGLEFTSSMEKINGSFTFGSWLLCSWGVSQPISGIISWSVYLWSSIPWTGETTENQFGFCLFVQPVIQTHTNPSVPKSDTFGHTVIETDKHFNATSLPLSLSGVLSTILVVLSMIIMLWLYIWLYIASHLNQVSPQYGHVIMCQNAVYWFSATKVDYCGC